MLTSKWPLGRNGPLTDPEVITLVVKPPNAAQYTVTTTPGPTGVITKVADGHFRSLIDLVDDTNDPGWWSGEWIGTATDTAVNSKARKPWRFHVEEVVDLT